MTLRINSPNHWQPVSESDQLLLAIIKRLLGKHPKLLSYIFHPTEPSLRKSSETLIREAAAFSSGELLLIRIALDIWSNGNSVRLMEIIGTFDAGNFENTITALRMLGPKT